MLADVGLEFGMSKRSRALIDDIMPQVGTIHVVFACRLIEVDHMWQGSRTAWLRLVYSCPYYHSIWGIYAYGYIVFLLLSSLTYTTAAESLREALPYLLAAEKDYECLDILEALQDVQYFISVVYHNLDMINERDAAARRHQATVEKREKLATVVQDEEVDAILDLIGRIGVALSSRK